MSPFLVLEMSNFIIFSKKSMLANSVDPDQTLRSVASDLGLHCVCLSPKQGR